MAQVRHFLKDTDINSEEQSLILSVAAKMKRDRSAFAETLKGLSVGLFFEKPSLRTRVSTQSACTMLGAEPVLLRAEELHFHRGETPQDGIKVLGGYLNLFLGRVYSHELLTQFAEPNQIPIVNGLCNLYHPLQALADILTIQESFNGRIKGKKLVYLGDGNNVAASLALAGCLAGIDVVICTPKELELPDYVKKEVALTNCEGTVSYEIKPEIAVLNADILYTDVWTSMGDEDNQDFNNKLLVSYSITSELVSKASSNAIVMHCLPAHFGEEITREVFESPKSRIIRQAHNRLPTAASVFLFCLDREQFLKVAR